MEVIGIKRLMDRLLDNPNLKNIKESSVAGYIKDMISISGLSSILVEQYIYRKVKDGRTKLPEDFISLNDLFLCRGAEELPPEYFDKGRMGYSTDTSILREGIVKRNLGGYRVNHDMLYIDAEEAIVELHYSAMPVDSYNFPVFPYDGSLMQAMENYVKFRYYTILGENNQVASSLADKPHREYTWYMAQYTSKSDMLSYDEAVAFAHSWQRLVDARNSDSATDGLQEFLNL